MSARESILGRLRSARAGARLPRPDAPSARVEAGLPTNDCLHRFELEATALGVECYVEDTAAAVRARLALLVAGGTILSWDPEHLPYQTATVVPGALLSRSPRLDQASADVGVTGCDAAVAETGSLAFFSGPGRSRVVSLLPPFHVAIVERHRLCFSMAEFFVIHAEPLRSSASCTFITGPSRTADIELTLTLGIHGPGRVAIVLGP